MVTLGCAYCGSKGYTVLAVWLSKDSGDGIMYQKNKCRRCGKETIRPVDLVRDGNKYCYIWIGYAYQLHRFVMEQKLKRTLKSTERVKFKNGNKGDCRPENLILVQKLKRKR